MEIFLVLLLIILIVVVLNQTGQISSQVDRLQNEIRSLRQQLTKFTEEKRGENREATSTAFTVKPKPVEEKKEIIIPPVKKPEPAPIVGEVEKTISVTTVSIKETITPPVKEEQKIPATFFERHPDMEKFIGENLVSKIGIAILVLAIGFFVKYAIDKDWIQEIGRVAIGILCGAILMLFAHKFRNTYKAFSSVLAGGGLAVFYFTTTLAYQQFHLFSQPVSFAIMVVITAFAVVISLLYDKQELAIIALIGGFAAPFLVNNGNGNYVALFIYLIILNAGLLVIAYHKAWRILNVLCFIFTAFIFGVWLAHFGVYLIRESEWKNGFLFATVFYLMFFVINIAHNIKEKKKFLGIDFGILLVNTCLYFTAGIWCLNKLNASDLQGLYSGSMGVFNLIASYFLFRKQKADVNIIYLLIGITLSFISITAPLQLHAHYITLFWATEAVLLFWLFTKSGIRIIKYASMLVWVAMLISLVIDLGEVYLLNNEPMNIIANKGFMTTLFAAIASYLMFVLYRNENNKNKPDEFNSGFIQKTFRHAAFLLLFIAGALEIFYQFNSHYPDADFYMLYLLLYTVTYITILSFFIEKQKLQKDGLLSAGLLLFVCLVLYVLGIGPTFRTQYSMLTSRQYGMHFIAHWLMVPIIGMAIYRLARLIQKSRAETKANYEMLIWVLCAIVVIYLSVEVNLLVNAIFYSWYNPLEEIKITYIKTGLPIVWGLCSFGFMWLGMHYKFRALRIISLSLFSITLFKLFIFDIRNIPAGGKIAAFFCLGVLLLVVSFMYQRLKKIIIEDEEKVG